MEGEYIEDMVKSLEEAGIGNVRAANPDKWSKGGMIRDAVSVPFENSRDNKESDFSEFGEEGEQNNMIGYSYGGLQAAQAAMDYADHGGKVDNLVLMGTPIEEGFLDELRKHPNITSVQVIDLDDQDDPVKAGMSDGEVIGAVPKLAKQMFYKDSESEEGHFYYSDNGPKGRKRRRDLAKELARRGLK